VHEAAVGITSEAGEGVGEEVFGGGDRLVAEVTPPTRSAVRHVT